ncbi:MAG: DUF1800 domain-containing protein [Planctomycetota bacterium]
MSKSIDHRIRRLLALTLVFSVCWVIAGAAVARLPERDLGPALNEREQAFHVLNRMAFGPAPGDVERVMEMGWEAWAREQLNPASIDAEAFNALVVERYPSLGMTLDVAMQTYYPQFGPNPSPSDLQRRNRLRNDVMGELRDSVLYRAVHSPRQFEEVMVEFWRNHFNIDHSKDAVAYMAPDFEETVIRRFAFGRFEHMLLASATHPAMLVYLDNVVSQKPLTEREQRLLERFEGRDVVPRSVQSLGRQRGLNENYARELMELHTLGVDRRYKQRDVTELARVLTGWSVKRTEGGGLEFAFREEVHDENRKRIFGRTVRGSGMDQGVSVIRGLARHSYTAEFISYKLCRYLVRDEPSDALVRRVARVFERTRGDLPSVYEAIIFSDDFMFRQNHRVKFKTPFEFTVSAIRATGAVMNGGGGTHQMLERMGQPIYRCVDPTGYYDQAEAWLDPGVLLYRWRFALALAGNDVKGLRVPDALQANVRADQLDSRLIGRVVPGSIEPRAREEIAQELRRNGAGAAWGLMLGMPEFQQQ